MKPIKNTSRKGDFAEYYAVTWLWDKGYEVFQNSGCSGPVDLIAIKNNEIITFNLKCLFASISLGLKFQFSCHLHLKYLLY